MKKAFVVGINYTGTSKALTGCINDAEDVRQLLKEHYGYDDKYILFLTDNTHTKPTKSNLYAGWRWLLSDTDAASYADNKNYIAGAPNGSRLYFHFSGHGGPVPDKNKDEADGQDEAIFPLDYEKSGTILDDDIRKELVDKVPMGVQLTSTMDCCNSGTNFDLRWNYQSIAADAWKLQQNGEYAATPGLVSVLSGGSDEDSSYEVTRNGRNNGVLTYSYLQVLSQKNYQISNGQLLQLVRQYISANSLSKQRAQLALGRWDDLDKPFQP